MIIRVIGLLQPQLTKPLGGRMQQCELFITSVDYDIYYDLKLKWWCWCHGNNRLSAPTVLILANGTVAEDSVDDSDSHISHKPRNYGDNFRLQVSLISIMGIPSLKRRHLYIEWDPWVPPQYKDRLSGYGDSDVKDKTVSRRSYLSHGDPYTDMATS